MTSTTNDPRDAPDSSQYDGLNLVYQWGYALEDEPTFVILPNRRTTRWFSSAAEAEAFRKDDLRWRVPTMLVKRLIGPVEPA